MAEVRKEVSPEVELEGVDGPGKRGRGRPKGSKNFRPPMSSILSSVKGVEDAAVEGGVEQVDGNMAAKILTLLGAIVIERSMTADEETIPLAKKADLAMRMPPFLVSLREGALKQEVSKYPATQAAVQAEIAKRASNIARFRDMLKKDPSVVAADKVLSELAPVEPPNG